MQNVGAEDFDYNTFKMAYDADETIQALTKRFDKNGVELNTKRDADATAPSDADRDSNVVSQMAKRATKKAQNR